MFIDGIGIANYRSFGEEVQRIGPFAKINFLIGRNNSGKSNILSFLKNHYQKALNRQKMEFSDLDNYDHKKRKEQVVEIGLSLEGENYKKIISRIDKAREHPSDLVVLIERILRSKTLTNGTDTVWFSYIGDGLAEFRPDILESLSKEELLNIGQWQGVLRTLTGAKITGGTAIEIVNTCITRILIWLSPCNLSPPSIDIIPAIRSVRNANETVNDFSGLGLNDRLFKLQNPPYSEPVNKRRFQKINTFVQGVLNDPSARLHIPYNKETIEVEIGGRALPISNVGTGVHQVIIIAAAATVLENQVVCIEEPELHCHPLLQKQLVKYLCDNTSNQYFISTHSAHLLDTPKASIFHVRLCDGKSIVENATNDVDKTRICDDLGYKASDLLQANCIIWVEGPSDRIYLNNWIHSIEPNLIEGLHYSIMFYGGRLLSRLTANDQEIEDFISLRRLNRHICIVIDSDASAPRKQPNRTKRRIRREFDKGPGFAWITKGREIENYIPADILLNVVRELYPKVTSFRRKDPYDKLLEPENFKGHKVVVDKIKIANTLRNSSLPLDILDLHDKIQRIVHFIKESNYDK